MRRSYAENLDLLLTAGLYLFYTCCLFSPITYVGLFRITWLFFNGSLLRLAWLAEKTNQDLLAPANVAFLFYALGTLISAFFLNGYSGVFLFALQSLFHLSLLGYAFALRMLTKARIL